MRAMWRAVALALACLIATAPAAHAQLITGTGLTATGAVTSITGTANQVVASAATGAVTLSLPQSIATSSIPQFAGLGIGAAGASAQILVPVGSAVTPSYGFTGAAQTGMFYISGSNQLAFNVGGGGAYAGVEITGLKVRSTGGLEWSSTSLTTDASDLFLVRGAPNTLQLKNDTNAQAFWLSNTWTSASVLEYLSIAFATNVARIGTKHIGATARVLTLDYGGTSTAAISIPITSGAVTFGGAAALGTLAFASLGTPADGTTVYCSNCDPVAVLTCTAVAGQTGALAFRVNGVWKCAG